MKKEFLISFYMGIVALTISLQSCSDDPITPNGTCSTTDTTWVDSTYFIDSTFNGNGGGWTDTLTGGGCGGTPIDSTWSGNPYDSTGYGG